MSFEINPFAKVGKFAQGDRFIGREKDLNFVLNQILSEAGVSIVGQRKIGKTSLARKIYLELQRDETFHPIFIDLGRIDTLDSFYNSMSQEVLKYVKKLMSDDYSNLFELFNNKPKCCSACSQDEIAFDQLTELLNNVQFLTNHPCRFVFFIDEFDQMRTFDSCNLQLQRIRSLSEDTMSYGAIFVLLSRRTLLAIEKLSDTSPLGNVYRKHFLLPFSKDEAMLMINKLSPKIEITQSLLEDLYCFSGFHPYLLEHALADMWDYHTISQNSQSSLSEYYQMLQKLLSEDELWDTLVKEVMWRIHDDSDSEAYIRLKDYGLIQVKSEQCISWSPSLDIYIKRNISNMAFNEQWAKVEKELRNLINDVMNEEYGSEWIVDRAKANSLIRNIFFNENNGCIVRQKKEMTTLGISSENLLDYTYTNDLWQIIDKYWEFFKDYFKGEKNLWEKNFHLLGNYRNPVAHSNGENLRSDQRQEFYRIINDIVKICELKNKK